MASGSRLTDGSNINRVLRLEGVCTVASRDGNTLHFYPDGQLTPFRRKWLEAGDGYRAAVLRDYVLLSAGL